MFSENYHIKKTTDLISLVGVWRPDKVWMPKTWKTPQLMSQILPMDGWRDWNWTMEPKPATERVQYILIKKETLIIPNSESLLSEYSNPFFIAETMGGFWHCPFGEEVLWILEKYQKICWQRKCQPVLGNSSCTIPSPCVYIYIYIHIYIYTGYWLINKDSCTEQGIILPSPYQKGMVWYPIYLQAPNSTQGEGSIAWCFST